MVEADVLYMKNVHEIRYLEIAVDSKVKRQGDVKAKIETMRQQIFQSYQKVDINHHTVTKVICITMANNFACSFKFYVM